MRKALLLFIFFLSLFFFNNNSVKAGEEKFITVVNPVRISSYTKDPKESLKSEYEVIKENSLPATWLFTFDALNRAELVALAGGMDGNQEFGIFLEVTPEFAKASGVEYHNTGFWHHATSVFLSGYAQEERKLLIDKVFEAFKDKFGYYPTSVGSWWTDSFSLGHMREKYGININLICSDQLSTDGYQIWGQPWMLPYYSSKNFSGVPAASSDAKLGVVNIQWAPRDPLNGYFSSLYSTQDYSVAPKHQDTDYFKKIVDLYTSYGQITVGLEADLASEAYRGEFSKQMKYVREKKDMGAGVVTMSEFAKRYMNKYPDTGPETLIEAEDFLGTGKKAFWYSGKKYRLFYTKDDKNLIIRDFRIYNSSLTEPYFVSPNYSFNLSINIPYVISEAEFPESVWILPKDAEITAQQDGFVVSGNTSIPTVVKNSDLLEVRKVRGGVKVGFSDIIPEPLGLKVKGLTSEAIHFFKQKKAVLYLLKGIGWNYFKKIDYLVGQGEVYSLLFLKSLPAGKVLVYDGECLQCVYHTPLKPAAFANVRKYVKDISGRKIVYNSSIFNSATREGAKRELKKTRAKYIYLVKFEEYAEKLPYSPGDLGVEMIFSNANAQIWRVK